MRDDFWNEPNFNHSTYNNKYIYNMRSTFIQYKYLVFKYVQKFLFNCGYASGRSNMTKRIAIDVEMRGVTNISLKGTCREKYT